MREPLNRKSKLHPTVPFVVIASTDKDVYQLATANGYKLPNLIDVARLRKLDKTERQRYAEDFWDASSRLRLHDRVAKEQSELNDVNKRLAEATQRHLEDQRQGNRTDLAEIDQLAREKRDTEKALKESRAAQKTLLGDTMEIRQSSRRRRAPVRFDNV